MSDENFIDASTGISGSGPAYVFYFMQSMMAAAIQMGFSENVSKILVNQTFTGAVELFNQNNLSPDSWMKKVASKGGTTQAALDSMEDNNVGELKKEAAFAHSIGPLNSEKKNKMYKELIVIKVGTNVMTNKDNRIVRPVPRRLVRQIAELYEMGIITILVSSGSVIAGKEVLGKSSIKDKTQRRQVYSAIGQPRMMRLYYNIFQDYGMKCAQVLRTKRDFSPGDTAGT